MVDPSRAYSSWITSGSLLTGPWPEMEKRIACACRCLQRSTQLCSGDELAEVPTPFLPASAILNKGPLELSYMNICCGMIIDIGRGFLNPTRSYYFFVCHGLVP